MALQTPVPFVAAFESTYLPLHDRDVVRSTGHDLRWREDLDAALAAGVTRFRYPLRWNEIEVDAGRYDWTEPDAVLGHLADRGAEVALDLVHHTSYPGWMADGFRDKRFAPAYTRYAEAVARRYPVAAYTLFNEPFATLWLAGSAGLWPPYDRGFDGFTRLLGTVLPAVGAASAVWAELQPGARHLWVDTCEHHDGTPGAPADVAAFANDRRHLALDLALGHDLDPARPAVAALLEAGGERLLDLPPVRVDVLGLDYYHHSEWWYDERGARPTSPRPVGFARLAEVYADRYRLPVMLSETNIRGLPSDRASWLRYMLEQYRTAVARGVPLEGFCWFPYVDSADWDSLLARPAGRIDPVGVVTPSPGGERLRTPFTGVWEAAAGGARPEDLPAYRFTPPLDAELAGYLPQMAHWPWQDPPADQPAPVRVDLPAAGASLPALPAPVAVGEPDLVVVSHLRWIWVWQRPQHLVSRMARTRAAAGARVWFVEEPTPGDVEAPELRHETVDGLTRVWLVVPRRLGQTDVVSFDAPGAERYGELVQELLAAQGRPARPDVLLYTPMALDVARPLEPGRLGYDVMDDLASFLRAPEGLVLRQRRLLAEADVVLAGGRSLHRSVAGHRRGRVHLFPSGVESAHFAPARALRQPRDRKVAGYVGVIDERLDLDLVAGLAAALPDWTVRMVGPVTKIDEADLPRAANLEYPGWAAYADLPRVMAGFDVALMPFALNEATRAISPTKTLEYLAAGLPVVSTRVPDVVADYSGVVHLADDAGGFAAACREVVQHSRARRDRRLRPLQERQEWDAIADAIGRLLAGEDAEDFLSAAPGEPA